MQNGVDNADQVRAAANVIVLPAAIYVAVSMPEPGRVKHLARGDLIIGPPSERTTELADLFVRAGIPCRMSDNIEGELWLKLLRNCALNAISALGHVRYGQIVQSGDAKKLMEHIVDEVLAVARAAGVVLAGVDDRESGMAAAMELAYTNGGRVFFNRAGFESRPSDGDRCTQRLHFPSRCGAWHPRAGESRIVHASEVG